MCTKMLRTSHRIRASMGPLACSMHPVISCSSAPLAPWIAASSKASSTASFLLSSASEDAEQASETPTDVQRFLAAICRPEWEDQVLEPKQDGASEPTLEDVLAYNRFDCKRIGFGHKETKEFLKKRHLFRVLKDARGDEFAFAYDYVKLQPVE